jgi:hypothetical protein
VQPQKVAARDLHRGSRPRPVGRQFEDVGVEPLGAGRAAAPDRAPVGEADADAAEEVGSKKLPLGGERLVCRR